MNVPVSRDRSRIGRDLLLAVASTALFLSLTEGFLRIAGWDVTSEADFTTLIARNVHGDLDLPFNTWDADLLWRPKPEFREGIIAINAEGYRDRIFPVNKPVGTKRILCLGDSSTFGWRLPLELTYVKILEQTLNAGVDPAGARRFEVVNFGVTGYTSAQGLELYRERGQALSPDVVIFYFGVNDAVRSYSRSDRQILRRRVFPSLVRLNQQLLATSRLYHLMSAAFSKVSETAASRGVRVPRVSLEEFRENVEQLHRLCKRQGTLLVLLSQPLCKEKEFTSGDRFLPSRQDLVAYRSVLEEVAVSRSIPLVSIDQLTERSTGPTSDFFFDPVHPNRQGHALIAAQLSEAIWNLLASR